MKHKETKYGFSEGIPAFEDVREFTLIERNDMLPLVILRAGELTFVSIAYKRWSIGYEPMISDSDLKALGVESRQDLELYNLVTMKSDLKDITTNLMAPIALNPKTRVGKQVMCKNRFPVRFKIWDEMKDELGKKLTIVGDVLAGLV